MTSVTSFFLIRHGETASNRDRNFNTYDIELTENGIEQARRVALWLAEQGAFSALYASDLARTMATAQVIGDKLGMAAQPAPELRELDTGDLKGLAYAEVDSRFPTLMEDWRANGGRAKLPGTTGESVADVLARASRWLLDALTRHRGERVIAVSHGWTLAILLSYVHGWDCHDAFSERRINLGNTAVSIVEAEDAGALRCSLLGSLAHL